MEDSRNDGQVEQFFGEGCPVLSLLGFFKRGRDSRDGAGLSAQL